CMLGAAQFFGFYSTRPDLYEARAAHSSGPAVHLISDLRYRVRIGTDEFALQSSVVAPSVRRDVEPETSVSPAKKWNVALIVVESLRNDQLVTFGGKRTVMEVVDELAQRSSRFINHRTQASHSDYADIAILSSHFPLRDPIYHIYPEDPAYPRIRVYDALKDAGYHVGIFSSQNESWGGMINYLESPSIDRLVHSENYDGPTYVPRGDAGFARFVKGSKRSGKIDDRYTIDEAISWTRSLPDGPFFFYMNLQNSHFPYERPADFPPKFGSGSVDFPIRFNDFPADSADAVIDLYSNALAYVDSQIDRLLKALQASGQLDSTVIIVTGDTGQAFYEHGFAAHGGPLFDEVMKVPLIISTPGGGPVEDNRPSQHIDIAPTILSLLGLPPHPGHQGRSLAGETWGGERSLFLLSQASAHQYAVVQHGFKLIYDAERQAYLLFDLMRDPAERFDLASAQRAQVESMAVLLHTWRRSQLAYYADPRLHQDWYPPLLDPASVGDR
ncbi:MAG: sulfatase, partial [Gemmatimonadota bacterium]|nr:sulfatase [Gemmatimonadota bacterium]